MDFPWPVVAAIVSVGLTFVIRTVQVALQNNRARRAAVNALQTELSLQRDLLGEAATDWEAWRKAAADKDRPFLLAIPTAPSIFENIDVTRLGLDQATIAAIVRYRANLASYTACLVALNSDRADQANPQAVIFMVDLAHIWQSKSKQSCDVALGLIQEQQ